MARSAVSGLRLTIRKLLGFQVEDWVLTSQKEWRPRSQRGVLLEKSEGERTPISWVEREVWGGATEARLPWTQLPLAKYDSAEKHLHISTLPQGHSGVLITV